ncbi:MAG: T9SS type A sorting domain-containing protein, partial [Bacteroidales bacterium]|nr:T9SS type A sorting domain-containing protein [Bacteroidales bacterium]
RKVEVYTLKGVKVKEEDVKAASTKMDVSDLSKGTYLLKVYTPKGVATKKLIIN